jgi:GNAT superfamily N-acetyltransferase
MKAKQATTSDEIEAARVLFKEYEAWLGISLCFQNFDQELASLPGSYAAPNGRLLLIFEEEKLAGSIALRPIDDATCEMKRLFLRSEFRGKGLGRKVVELILKEARTIGYQRIRLDTLPGRMNDAISLYRSFGFREIDSYYDTPFADTLFMELKLG